jgi:hypothetical protein
MLAQGWPVPFWHMLRVFYDGDSYPPLGLYFKFFDVAVSVLLSRIASRQKLMASGAVHYRLWGHCKAHCSTKGKVGVILSLIHGFTVELLLQVWIDLSQLDHCVLESCSMSCINNVGSLSNTRRLRH